jgi:hypothetical protein
MSATLRPSSLKLKDPDSIRNGQFDWSAFLGTAQIIFEAIAVSGTDAALVVDSVGLDATGQKVNYRISGGTLGVRYRVRCRVATDENPQQIEDRSLYVLCQPA